MKLRTSLVCLVVLSALACDASHEGRSTEEWEGEIAKRGDAGDRARSDLAAGGAAAVPVAARILEEGKTIPTRVAASEILAEIGEPAVESLVAALEHEEEHVRDLALRALASIGLPAAAARPALLVHLEKDPPLVESTARALLDIGPNDSTVEALASAAASTDAMKRQRTIRALVDREALPVGTEGIYLDILFMSDSSRDLRIRAARLLDKADGGAKEIVVPLLLERLLESEVANPEAVEAIASLGKGREDVVPRLIEALESRRTVTRAMAAEALCFLREEAAPAIPAMIGALGDESPDVRIPAHNFLYFSPAGRVCVALTGLPADSPGAVAALDRALDDPGRARRDCAAIVLVSYAPRSVPPRTLVRVFENGNLPTQALAMLQAWGPEAREVVPSLLEAADSKNRDVRQWLAMTLGRIEDPRALPVLREMLGDPDREVREAAQQAIESIPGD